MSKVIKLYTLNGYSFIHKLYLNKIIGFTEANSSFSHKIENVLFRHIIFIQYILSSLIVCISSYHKLILNFFHQVPSKWPQIPSNSFQYAIQILWMPKYEKVRFGTDFYLCIKIRSSLNSQGIGWITVFGSPCSRVSELYTHTFAIGVRRMSRRVDSIFPILLMLGLFLWLALTNEMWVKFDQWM